MALVTIKSENPEFSYVISKNPATIRDSREPFKKKLRSGNVYGWYVDDNTFRLWFKDSDYESSFALNSEFEYLDIDRYGNPYALIQIIDTAIRISSGSYEYDKPYRCTITFDAIAYNKRLLDGMIAWYSTPGVSVNVSALGASSQCHRFVVTANSVSESIAISQVLCLTLCMTFNKQRLPYITEDFLVKWAKRLNSVNAPYYVRYRMASLLSSSEKNFDSMNEFLSNDTIKMVFGDTQMQRYRAIKNVIQSGGNLVDAGCGTLYYSKRLNQNYDTVYAIEGDEFVFKKASRVLEGTKIDNVSLICEYLTPSYVDECGLFSDAVVLMTEVIEHMPKDDAMALLNSVLKASPKQLIVTAPNFDFNPLYWMEQPFRHDDHIWEPTAAEFSEFVLSLESAGYKVVVNGIGDSVAGVHTSQMAVFSKE